MSLEKFLATLWKFDEKSHTETAGTIQRYLQEIKTPITFTNFQGMFRGIPAFCNKDGVFLNAEIFNFLGTPQFQVPLGIYILIHEIQHYIQYTENPVAFYLGSDTDPDIFRQTVERNEKDADEKTVNTMRKLKMPHASVPNHNGEGSYEVISKIQKLYQDNIDKYETFGDAQYDVVVNGTAIEGLDEIRKFVRRALR